MRTPAGACEVEPVTLVVPAEVVVPAADGALEDSVEDAAEVAGAALVEPVAVLGGVLDAFAEPLVHPATSAAEPPINSARREVLTAGGVGALSSGRCWVNGRLLMRCGGTIDVSPV